MKLLLASMLAFSAFTASAETSPKRTPLRVFATFEDMVADRPVEGITLDFTNYKGYQKKSERIFLVENGATREVDLTAVKYWGYTNPDGSIRRIFEGESYACMALGKKCYYQGRRPYNMESGNSYMRDWVSDGPNGPITMLCEVPKRMASSDCESAQRRRVRRT